MFSEYRGIPREARLLIYLSFVPNIIIGFIYTDLSYFLPTVQNLTPFWSGITITIMGMTLVVESIPMGVLSDRHGRRNMLVLGNICASLSLIGFALTNNPAVILVVAVLEGTGEASFAVSLGALLAEKAGDEKRTAAFSLQAFLGWIGGSLGGFAVSSLFIFESVGLGIGRAHTALYIVLGLLGLSVTPLLFKIRESETITKRKGILPRKSGGVLKKYIAYSATIAVGAGLFVPLMAFWFKAAYGVPDVVSGPVLGFTSLLTAGVVFLSPRLARRLGLVKATVLTQAASTAFMVAIPSCPTFPIAATIYVVRVFLMNLSNPLIQSLIMGLISPDERGMASGVTAALWRLPNSLSTSVGFALIGEGFLGLPFYVATVLYVIGISAFWYMFKDVRLPEEASQFQLSM